MKPDPSDWSYQIHKRWRLMPAIDRDENEIPGMLELTVVTPDVTGPRAASVVMITKEGAGDRKFLASQIRDARRAATLFRQTHEPPVWHNPGP